MFKFEWIKFKCRKFAILVNNNHTTPRTPLFAPPRSLCALQTKTELLFCETKMCVRSATLPQGIWIRNQWHKANNNYIYSNQRLKSSTHRNLLSTHRPICIKSHLFVAWQLILIKLAKLKTEVFYQRKFFSPTWQMIWQKIYCAYRFGVRRNFPERQIKRIEIKTNAYNIAVFASTSLLWCKFSF